MSTDDANDAPTAAADNARYRAALHAMQTGVAHWMNYDPGQTSPKHLRVGVNSAFVSSAALADLLVKKGIISVKEYTAAQADFMEREAASYQKLLSDHLGTGIVLG